MSDDYKTPFKFTGKIEKVIISKVNGSPRRLAVRVGEVTVEEDEPVALHTIRVDGLRPDTMYEYVCRLRTSDRSL